MASAMSADKTCVICGDDYKNFGFVKCSKCSFEVCGPCLSSIEFKCPQCRTSFPREVKNCITTQEFAIITKACFEHGKLAAGGNGLEKANKILLRKLYIAEETIRHHQLAHEYAIQLMQSQHERAIRRIRFDNDDANIERLRSEHDTNIQRLRSEYDTNIQRLRSENDSNIKQLRSENDSNIRQMRSDVIRYKLIISRLINPKKGPKSKMCKHFDLMVNLASNCSNGSRCTFAHNFTELIADN